LPMPGFIGPDGTGGSSKRTRRNTKAAYCCTFAQSTMQPGCGSTADWPRFTRGGYTPFAADVTELLRVGGTGDRGAGMGRSGGSFQTARQSGLAIATAFHLVSKDHRHTVDSVDGVGAAKLHRVDPLDAEPGAMGNRRRSLDQGRAAR
jgi:hypothetical protein